MKILAIAGSPRVQGKFGQILESNQDSRCCFYYGKLSKYGAYKEDEKGGTREVNEQEVPAADIDRLYGRLHREAEASGYHLNPDIDFTKGLVQGLLVNERRYGYWACPCRLASGNKRDDIDIICPCDYRDPDLNDYDTCYCALYVSEAVRKGEKKIGSIPERRLPPAERKKKTLEESGRLIGLSLPVWRCKVCGYLCAREQPPEVCPICKARKDRFELFLKPTKPE